MKTIRFAAFIMAMFACMASLSAQTKDEVKADKAKARKEIPAYRQKGYAGSVSLNSELVYALGLETSHGYMFNVHHYLGAGVGFNILPMLYPPPSTTAYFTRIFVEYKAFILKRSNTPVLGVRAAFSPVWWKSADGQMEMRDVVWIDPGFGWDWKLKDNLGLNVGIGVNLMYNITNDIFGALPRVSLGFQF